MKCPVCGKEIQNPSPYCPWCGIKLPEEVLSEEKPVQQWPEEEKSISFTIYDANDHNTESDVSSSNSSVNSSSNYNKTGEWKSGHILTCVVMLLFICGIVTSFCLYQDSTESRMPDYSKVIEKEQMAQEKMEQKMLEQKREAQRIEENLRRQREEEEKAQQLLLEQSQEEVAEDDAFSDDFDNDALEAKIIEILER